MYIDNLPWALTCVNPENFVRGRPTQTTLMREERIKISLKISLKRAIIGSQAKRHLNGVLLADQWPPNIECWLMWFFRSSGLVLLRNPIFFGCKQFRYDTFQNTNIKGTDQTAWISRLVYGFVVRKSWRQVFSRWCHYDTYIKWKHVLRVKTFVYAKHVC